MQAGVQAYLNATKAYGSLVGIPVVGPALAVAASGLVLGAGLAQVRAIEKQKFAEGGLVTKPTLALIGEGGQDEFVAPKQQFKDWATDQMQELSFNADNGGTIGKLQEIHTAITSQEFPTAERISDAVLSWSARSDIMVENGIRVIMYDKVGNNTIEYNVTSAILEKGFPKEFCESLKGEGYFEYRAKEFSFNLIYPFSPIEVVVDIHPNVTIE